MHSTSFCQSLSTEDQFRDINTDELLKKDFGENCLSCFEEYYDFNKLDSLKKELTTIKELVNTESELANKARLLFTRELATRELATKETELAIRELATKVNELATRELDTRELATKERELATSELATKEKELATRELAAKEKELATRERELATRERELATRELAAKEKELATIEKDLATRERELATRELAAKEKELTTTKVREFATTKSRKSITTKESESATTESRKSATTKERELTSTKEKEFATTKSATAERILTTKEKELANTHKGLSYKNKELAITVKGLVSEDKESATKLKELATTEKELAISAYGLTTNKLIQRKTIFTELLGIKNNLKLHDKNINFRLNQKKYQSIHNYFDYHPLFEQIIEQRIEIQHPTNQILNQFITLGGELNFYKTCNTLFGSQIKEIPISSTSSNRNVVRENSIRNVDEIVKKSKDIVQISKITNMVNTHNTLLPKKNIPSSKIFLEDDSRLSLIENSNFEDSDFSEDIRDYLFPIKEPPDLHYEKEKILHQEQPESLSIIRKGDYKKNKYYFYMYTENEVIDHNQNQICNQSIEYGDDRDFFNSRYSTHP